MKLIPFFRKVVSESKRHGLAKLRQLFKINQVKFSEEKWQADAQTNEFDWHKHDEWRPSKKFAEDNERLLRSWGFNESDYSGQMVVDLGAGSKLRTRFFKDAELVVIEPLADKFLKEIPWCDLNDAQKVYSTAAEERIAELEGQADFVMSVNVLDHCYDFQLIIENIYSYLKKGGLAFLSFDEHFITDKMHPLVLTDSICSKIFLDLGFTIEQKTRGFSEDVFQVTQRHNYGHGTYCLNYWLRK